MTPNEQLAALDKWLADNPAPWSSPRDLSPAAFEDEDTLRRSRRGLSSSARREQRRPVAFVADELGFLPNGSWSPDAGAA